MKVIVQKFGGTSVGSIDRILSSAKIVEREIIKGNKVVVVVSAMAGTTDSLIGLTKSVMKTTRNFALAEYDAIISSGEQISAGLFVLALNQMGIKARSWQGWQLPIITDKSYSKAFIKKIYTSKIIESISCGEVAVVTGFQGLSEDNRITTLGRGGSDTSAVALAVALNAKRCDIYTDVDGVYSADPRIVPLARKLNYLTYDEMIEMASLGSKVLQVRSVTIAKEYKLNLRVLSAFVNGTGTNIVEKYSEDMERNGVSGISLTANESRISINTIDNKISCMDIMTAISSLSIHVDMILSNNNYIEFNITDNDIDIFMNYAEKENIKFNINKNICKISLIGSGIKSNPEILRVLYNSMKEKAIEIYATTLSELKISFIINSNLAELAMKTLHSAYGLDEKINESSA